MIATIDMLVSQIKPMDYKFAILLMGYKQICELQNEMNKHSHIGIVAQYCDIPIVQVPEVDYGPTVGYLRQQFVPVDDHWPLAIS